MESRIHSTWPKSPQGKMNIAPAGQWWYAWITGMTERLSQLELLLNPSAPTLPIRDNRVSELGTNPVGVCH
jgi:hypothetical protein